VEPAPPSAVSNENESMFEKMSRMEEAAGQGRPTLYNKAQIGQFRRIIIDESAEEDEDPDSQANRRHRAVRQHIQTAPIFNVRNKGA